MGVKRTARGRTGCGDVRGAGRAGEGTQNCCWWIWRRSADLAPVELVRDRGFSAGGAAPAELARQAALASADPAKERRFCAAGAGLRKQKWRRRSWRRNAFLAVLESVSESIDGAGGAGEGLQI